MGLLPSLLAGLHAVCATFPDPRKGRSGNIAMTDFGLAAFALFFMQSASFLSFQRTLEKGQGRLTAGSRTTMRPACARRRDARFLARSFKFSSIGPRIEGLFARIER